MATAIRPIGHEDRLSIVEHLDELRSRLIIMVLTLVAAFTLCFIFNNQLLDVVGKPLSNTTKTRTLKGQGPLGEIYVAQRAARQLAQQNVALDTALLADKGLSEASRTVVKAQLAQAQITLKQVPKDPPPNKPITLGVSEPFVTTATVALYFALLIAGPIILWQLYAFLLPAFSPEERKVALPLMSMIPVLFIMGVVFGYFLVLPAATSFLQNFNSGSFNVLVQASGYYKFTAMLLLAMGLVFQLPVGILALTRMNVLSVRMLRKNRRYAILVLTVVAAALPGVDPVSMLVELVPLLLLYEVSIIVARLFGGPEPAEGTSRWSWSFDDDDEDEDDDHEDNVYALHGDDEDDEDGLT